MERFLIIFLLACNYMKLSKLQEYIFAPGFDILKLYVTLEKQAFFIPPKNRILLRQRALAFRGAENCHGCLRDGLAFCYFF